MANRAPLKGKPIEIIIIPQPGLPEGVLTYSNKECLKSARPSGSPITADRFPRCGPAGSPSPWTLVPPKVLKKIAFGGLKSFSECKQVAKNCHW